MSTETTNDLERMSPHSLEAERCLIASLMLDRGEAEQLVPKIRDDDFFLTDHRIMFSAIRGLMEENRPLDAVILRDELKATNQLDAIGGAS